MRKKFGLFLGVLATVLLVIGWFRSMIAVQEAEAAQKLAGHTIHVPLDYSTPMVCIGIALAVIAFLLYKKITSLQQFIEELFLF